MPYATAPASAKSTMQAAHALREIRRHASPSFLPKFATSVARLEQFIKWKTNPRLKTDIAPMMLQNFGTTTRSLLTALARSRARFEWLSEAWACEDPEDFVEPTPTAAETVRMFVEVAGMGAAGFLLSRAPVVAAELAAAPQALRAEIEGVIGRYASEATVGARWEDADLAVITTLGQAQANAAHKERIEAAATAFRLALKRTCRDAVEVMGRDTLALVLFLTKNAGCLNARHDAIGTPLPPAMTRPMVQEAAVTEFGPAIDRAAEGDNAAWSDLTLAHQYLESHGGSTPALEWAARILPDRFDAIAAGAALAAIDDVTDVAVFADLLDY